MPLMIRQGDTTSHGGTVLEGFSLYTVEGPRVNANMAILTLPV